jgi:hypothetical protein
MRHATKLFWYANKYILYNGGMECIKLSDRDFYHQIPTGDVWV